MDPIETRRELIVALMLPLAKDVIELGGFRIAKTGREALIAIVLRSIEAGQPLSLFFANTNLVVRCQAFKARFAAPDVLIVNDGIGLEIGARLVRHDGFPENLNGTDFTPALMKSAPRPLRIFAIGGQPVVLARVVERLQVQLGQNVVGAWDGYRDLESPALIAELQAASPDVVLVALGNPLQERWILDHRAALARGVMIGVGGLFDFMAGAKARAPKWVQKMKLEWAFRLSLEPRRLARRYTLDILTFLSICYRQR